MRRSEAFSQCLLDVVEVERLQPHEKIQPASRCPIMPGRGANVAALNYMWVLGLPASPTTTAWAACAATPRRLALRRCGWMKRAESRGRSFDSLNVGTTSGMV